MFGQDGANFRTEGIPLTDPLVYELQEQVGRDMGDRAADHHPSISHGEPSYSPTVIDVTDHISVGNKDVVEKDLGKVCIAGDLAQSPPFDAGRVHVDHHDGEAGVLLEAGVGSNESITQSAVMPPLVQTF
jgi:hypothetical protein